jgi:hypothetical protein
MIAQRTKDALQAAKARGVSLKTSRRSSVRSNQAALHHIAALRGR